MFKLPLGEAKGCRGRLCAAFKHPGHPERSGWLVYFLPEYPMNTLKLATRAASGGRFTSGAIAMLRFFGACFAGVTAAVSAAPGDLDPNFGTNGFVIFDQGEIENWDKILPLPNGDLLVAGYTRSSPSLTNAKHIVQETCEIGADDASFLRILQ